MKATTKCPGCKRKPHGGTACYNSVPLQAFRGDTVSDDDLDSLLSRLGASGPVLFAIMYSIRKLVERVEKLERGK